MTTEVSPETVEHVAALARIELTDDELERYAAEFETILEHFETLDAVPDVETDAPLTNVLRPDRPEPGLERTRALENAPETEDGHFRGPNVS